MYNYVLMDTELLMIEVDIVSTAPVAVLGGG
jgi:hypothetical protein